jgi:hypothetical protein
LVQAPVQLARRLPRSCAIADDERWKNLHYGDRGVLSPSLGLEFLSWKTGEGIAIGAGGASSTMILAAAVVAVTAAVADGITVAAAGTARRRDTARRVLRSSHRVRRSRRW